MFPDWSSVTRCGGIGFFAFKAGMEPERGIEMVSRIREVEGQEEGRAPLRPALYTLEEVGELMGMSYPAIWGHYSAGSLPWEPLKVGRKVLFRKRDVDADLGIESAE